jgi:putative membrane-bound dehydrogenase-like protein
MHFPARLPRSLLTLSALLTAPLLLAQTQTATGVFRRNGDPPLKRIAGVDDLERLKTSPVLQQLRDNPAKPSAIANASAQKLVAGLKLMPGFQAELLAAEPDLAQPVAMAIDERGRLWIAEAFGYPQRQPEGQGKDRILIFEDKDGDGTFETKKVFADKLNLVSGLEVGFGGVWVGAAPYLYFIPDRNDDLVPDGPPEVLLDGWGYEDTHETLNSFTWGPDGWLYGCHGVFTHSNVGKPGASDAERTPLNAGVWRYHPQRREFEVFAWGTSNPWGIDFDARGQCFVTACVIPHLFHLAQGGRYLRQAGAHFDPHVYEDIGTIADHRHYLGDDPHGGNLRSNAAGGGHAHCGALIYQARQFPDEWRGRILMDNIHGNRVNADELVPSGSGFVGKHAEDLLLANDTWFRGISLELSPEGSVYLIDWYDKQACHWTEPGRWDRSNGRLYRVSYGEHRPLPVDLTRLPSEDLVRHLFSSNEWFARRARVLLAERGLGEGTRAILRDIARRPGDGERRLRALWALHSVAGLGEALGLELCGADDPAVRAWAVQCLLERRSASKAVQAKLVELADDAAPLVRLYVASALQRLPVEQRFPIAQKLVAHAADGEDPNLPLLVWYAIEPLATRPEGAALVRATKIPKLERFLYRRCAAEEALREPLLRALSSELNAQRRTWILDELVSAVRDEPGKAPASFAAVFPKLRADVDPHVHDQALELALAWGDASTFEDVQAIARDTAAAPERRTRALEALIRGKDARTGKLLGELLGDSALRAPALRGLASFPEVDAPAAILARYAELAPAERRDAVATLCARAPWARALLAAVGDGRVPKSELSPFQLRALRQFDDPEVTRLLDAHIGVVRASDERKTAEIARIRALLDSGAPGDLARGREVFARTCQQCHTLFGVGRALGPDLTGANRSDREYLLSNVIEPSGVVPKEYQATIARLKDGRLVTGIERERTDTAITLESENARSRLALNSIEELELSALSTMPDGLLDGLDPDEIRALFAYLASPHQTAMVATSANLAGFFDQHSLANWHGDPDVWSVADGQIVGRTEGLERNAFLKSEYELGDFRLTVEVRLVGDQGNSGIQFRSREHEDGGMVGYQADIGPGWWGKLYEEEGRGLLVERGASRVIPDDWNRYVIECSGSSVRTWLNGEPCVEFDDPAGARRGIFALQVHSGGPTEVRFRNFHLELLSAR